MHCELVIIKKMMVAVGAVGVCDTKRISIH